MEEWDTHKKEQRERRAKRLSIRTQELLSLRKEGFKIQQKTIYHFRVRDVLDVWPIHNRYHDIKKSERGGFRDVKSFVKRFFKGREINN